MLSEHQLHTSLIHELIEKQKQDQARIVQLEAALIQIASYEVIFYAQVDVLQDIARQALEAKGAQGE